MQANSQVLLNCPQATEWCVLVYATLVEHVALILGLCVSNSFSGFAVHSYLNSLAAGVTWPAQSLIALDFIL